MVYKVIGLMSGSSLDGLDIAYVHLQERASPSSQAPRQWEYTIVQAACYPYTEDWRRMLSEAPGLSARDYQLLHTEYGHYLGEQVLRFIEEAGIHYQVQLIASHGHTVFHMPERKMTAQLGDGAALAARTRINVVSDLRAMDLALGGQGAPIVPIGEKLLLPGYEYYLNLGGIANLSRHGGGGEFVAFDVCPANRVLNLLAGLSGQPYDKDGEMAATGQVNDKLLERLNQLPYYGKDYPKSLANDFGTGTVYPMIRDAMEAGVSPGSSTSGGIGLSIADALRTYVEHIAVQIKSAVWKLQGTEYGVGAAPSAEQSQQRILATGGGAHNAFLMERVSDLLTPLGIGTVVAEPLLIDYKEAVVMALIAVLRWREENNVLASVTGASRDSIGGAVWIGQEV
ncbi:MAG TPA: anhydro-N-acetylmuramic acid kinase [Puia sp.]|nr:anhydro-N-acetylmuramic acid kinase [Puia sp.]